MTNLTKIFIPLLVVTVMSCTSSDENESDTNAGVGKTVNVETKVLSPTSFNSSLRVVGMIESKNDIVISAEVNGRVTELSVAEGAEVKKGQSLLKIDDSKLMQEKARLESTTNQAKDTYERLKKVYEEENIGSEMDYLNAMYNYQQAKASLESIKVDLENTRIKAPFTGRVERFALEPGEMASPGMPVARLIGSDNYIVSVGVPARYADVIQNGEKVKIWFDSQQPDTLDGIITFVGNSINPQDRTFKAEALLPTRSSAYKVDMIANVLLNTLSEDNVIVISEEFVYKEENEFVTYVKTENELGQAVAERRVVTLGPTYKSNVIIRDGLNPGEELITIGSAFLNDGMRLNIVESRNNNLTSR